MFIGPRNDALLDRLVVDGMGDIGEARFVKWYCVVDRGDGDHRDDLNRCSDSSADDADDAVLGAAGAGAGAGAFGGCVMWGTGYDGGAWTCTSVDVECDGGETGAFGDGTLPRRGRLVLRWGSSPFPLPLLAETLRRLSHDDNPPSSRSDWPRRDRACPVYESQPSLANFACPFLKRRTPASRRPAAPSVRGVSNFARSWSWPGDWSTSRTRFRSASESVRRRGGSVSTSVSRVLWPSPWPHPSFRPQDVLWLRVPLLSYTELILGVARKPMRLGLLASSTNVVDAALSARRRMGAASGMGRGRQSV